MKKTLTVLVTIVVGAFALTGCIYVPASLTVETETPVVETPEVQAPTTDELYLEAVREELPEAQYFTDSELIQLASDACTIARGAGFEEGALILINELNQQGATEDEAYVVGFIYGSAVIHYCPETIE